MSINALRVGELLADDSNFRAVAIYRLGGPMAQLLTLRDADFQSRWCGGESVFVFDARGVMISSVRVCKQKVKFSQHAHAGLEAVQLHIGDEIFINHSASEVYGAFEAAAQRLLSANMRKHRKETCALALERSVRLFQLLANMHHFNDTEDDASLRVCVRRESGSNTMSGL